MATSSSGRVFAHLKQRSRSSFVGQHRLDVVVHSRLEHGPKYISLSTLKNTFGVAGLVLTEEEVDYLIKRFADNRRHIEWRRLMLALDVAAPADFTDPDLSFLDNLPQPYRLIVSVLDTEIVDRAWALIVDRHPELDTSTTDEARAAADIDLKRSCPPSVRLQNPHPPLLLDRCPRGAETTEAADGDATDQVEAERALKKRPNGNGDDDRTARAGARGNDGGMTLLRWDRCGELLFTAGRDGSVCLRAAGALEDIAVQISSIHTRPTSSDGNEEMMEAGAPWEVTFLSEPVGTLTDQRGRPSSVRIAAVTTSANQEEINSDGAQDAATVAGGGGDTAAASGEALPSVVTVVSVLEVAVSETSSSPGAGFGGAAGTGHLNDSHDDFSSNGPTLRAICDVELTSSEAAVACALSPDGRRLAVCLTDGRIVTWVLPAFSPVLRGSQQHNPGAGEQTATQHGGDGDEGASLGDSSASLAGKDDAASMTKEAAAAAAAEAAAVEQPLRLTRPEFSIAHLPSPEELAYAEKLQEYRRRVEAGELQEPTTGSGGAGEFQEGCTPPPQAPQLSGCAHHLARVEFLPVPAGLNGGSGGWGGLSVWRANSNVWRLYRLPAPPSEGESKPESSEGKVTDAAAGGEDSNETRRGIGPIVPPKFDISSLPSAEWVLPSPITTLAVSEGDEGGGRGGGIEDDERRVHQAGGGPGCDWSCCGSTASTGELAPMVAIGTESGGVYLCDAALGTTREALSRHRARVTTLAFHRKRFVVSGSADEMLQIHHIAAPASVVGGGSCCAGGTPRLRCLHDARGSGIVRITCLRAAPLAFAEDTSGRIVVYDLLTGSMLGVLALGNSSTASAAVAKPGTIGDHGVAPSAETIPQKPRVVWAGGGDRLAAVIPEEKEGDASGLSPMLPARNEALGVWSGSDVMWNLSPGLRAIVGEERPRDVAALFFGLLPAQRKNAEGNLGFGAQPLLPPPSPPTAGRSRTHRSENDRPRRGTTPPPRTGTAGTTSRSHRSAAAAGGTSSRDTGLGGRGSAGSERPAAASKANLHTEHHKTNNRHHTTALTEGNVAKFLGGVAGGNRFGGVCAEGGFGAGRGGAGVAWRSEVGAAGRVKRYMQERHGDRAARQARLDNATRNLLHAL